MTPIIVVYICLTLLFLCGTLAWSGVRATKTTKGAAKLLETRTSPGPWRCCNDSISTITATMLQRQHLNYHCNHAAQLQHLNDHCNNIAHPRQDSSRLHHAAQPCTKPKH